MCPILGQPTSWSIDGNWNLNSFVLAVNLFDFFGPLVVDEEFRFTFVPPASNGLNNISGSDIVGCILLSVPCGSWFGSAGGLATAGDHVPEPATVLLFTAGLALLAGMAREKSHKRLA